MQDNLKGAIAQAGGSLETLGIDLYESVDNPAKKAVQAVTDYVNQLSKAFEGKGWDGFTKEIGTVAADAVKQIAAAAPAAVKEGSNLIKSLADGISDNSDDIAKSAVEIGKSLISGIEETVPALGKAAGGLVKGVLSEIAGPEAGQAVQDTMDSIGQAFQSLKGPAQDAIKSTIQIIGNLASAVSEVSQTVLPVLSSALGFAAQNIQTVGPIVLGVVGAFKEFTTVKTAAQSVVKFTDSMLTAVKAGGKAEMALKGISGAAGALTGPVGLAIAAVVGVTAAVVAWSIANDDFALKEKKVRSEIESTSKSLEASKDAWIDSNSQIQYTTAVNDKQIEGIQGLKKELDSLVDAHGNVKRGEEKHVDTILNLLNPALGTELKRSGEVVTGYDNQGKSIDTLIKKKQALADIEAHASKLQAATQGKQQQEKVQDDQTSKIIATRKQMKELEQSKDFDNPASPYGKQDRKKWKSLNEDLNSYLSNYQKATGLISSYDNEISKNQQAQAEIDKGNYDKAREILNKQTLAFSTAAGASREQLATQAKDLGSHFAALKEKQKNGDKSVTNQAIADAQDLAVQATQEYQKAGGAVGDGYIVGFNESTGAPVYAAAKELNAKTVLAAKLNANEAKTQFKALGFELTDAEANGLVAASPKVQQAAVQALYNVNQKVQSNSEQLSAFFGTLGIKLPKIFAEHLATQSGDTQSSVANMFLGLRQNVSLNSVQLTQLFKSIGTSAPRGLVESLNGQKANVQQAAIQVINSITSGVAPGKDQLTSLFKSMGVESATALLDNLSTMIPGGIDTINKMLGSMGIALNSDGKLVTAGKGKAQQTITTMDQLMAAARVSSPGVDGTNLISGARSAAETARNAIIAELTGQSITVGAQIAIAATGGSVNKSANGRIANHMMLSTLCEEGYPEAIIPFNPARRGRALDLWQQTGKALGVMQNANGGIYGTLPSNPKVAVSASMMSSILGWAKINTSKDDKLSEKIVEQAEKALDNLKQYDELSTAEEVKFWEKVKKIRGLAGDQLNEIDHKIYDAKKANSEAIVSDAESYLNHYKNIGQMTDDWELSYWQRTLQREGLFADQKKEIEEKIYALQKQRTQDIISDAEKRFSHAEAIGQQDAQAELQYWQNLVKTEKLGGDEYNSVLEKIYSAQQKVKEELSQKSKDNYDYFNGFIQDDKDFGKIDTAGELARWKKVYDDYKNGLIFLQADEAKQIEKNIYSLQKEVDSSAQSAQDTAKQNWQSRVDSLKSWTGMFDEPSYNYETSKEELMWNMQEQVRMMQDWQSDLANLQARGISSAMSKELENLGPASADKIRALSEMTDEELQKYSNLYATKGSLATGQANAETGITSTVTDSAAVAVTQSVQSSVSSLSDAVQQQLPTLTAQFQQGGTSAGNAYGSAFVARVKSAMSDFNGVVTSAVSNAQVQLSSTMQAANAASSAIDRLNAKVSGMKVEQVQQVTQLDVSGRQLAKAVAPYAGTYLKLNGG
ncbi:MAG: hypothetical protein E7572_05915 [Ruminococcaceae bacterium]|nr:hypothetical protein [Oscillospiraceae bacterium]